MKRLFKWKIIIELAEKLLGLVPRRNKEINGTGQITKLQNGNQYLAHVIEQPILNLEYLQRKFCFDFFNDSENTF